MDGLRQILEMDRTDCEIIGLALDTLCNITNPKTFDEEGKECASTSFFRFIDEQNARTCILYHIVDL